MFIVRGVGGRCKTKKVDTLVSLGAFCASRALPALEGPVSLRYFSAHQVPTGNKDLCRHKKYRATEIGPLAMVGTVYQVLQEAVNRGTGCIYAYMKSLLVDWLKMADIVPFLFRVVGAE